MLIINTTDDGLNMLANYLKASYFKAKNLKTLALVLLLGFSQSSMAKETLMRSAFLGLMPETADPGQAVIVASLHEKGTGQALGLTVGDTIQSVNDQAIKDFSDLIAQLNQINEGELITVKVNRKGKTVELTATAQGRAKEQGEGFKVIYDQLAWQNEQIRTIQYLPDSPRKDQAAVLFIQGYTCGSIDYGMMPNVSLNQLLSGFAQAGFTILKMEKPGVGDSQGQLRCEQYDFNTEHQAFRAGLTHLKQLKGVNPNNVFVFGHSLGVLHASLIAEQGLAKGVIGYGGVVKPWHDYLIDIYAKQSVKYWGVSKGQANENVEAISPFLHSWLNTDENWQQVLNSPSSKQALAADILPIDGEQIFHRHYQFFRSVNKIDFIKHWANSSAHTLMLHGSFDIQAIESGWQTQIAKLTNKKGQYTGESKTFAKTDHALMQYKNKDDLMKATRRQANGLGQYNQEITQASIAWMEKIAQL